VLLLNATLASKTPCGGPSKKGWEQFTDAVIQHISEERRCGGTLWGGGFAKKIGSK
jgi:uracil-DNA glycosylase